MQPRQPALLTSILVLFALVLSPLASPALATPNLTFTVTANTDMVDALPGDGVCETATGNGMCTLRAAIMEANAHIGEDVIDLPAATYQLTIPGANENLGATGDLDITDSVWINGPYKYDTVIDAIGLGDRLLDISGNGVTVFITDVTIQNGSATGSGGGIRAMADLTLQDFYMDNNQASLDGGAIYSNHPLTLINGTIYGSSAGGDGGALFTSSDLSANPMFSTLSVQMSDNSADGAGGAIYASESAHVHLEEAHFSSNTAVEDGGTIYNAGELVMEGGTITEGEAGLIGGGIFAAVDAQTTLTDVLISYNHAVNNGGGIYTDAGSVLIGQGLTLDHNSIDFHGGALYVFDGEAHLRQCVLSSNTALYSGGAIANSLGEITIEASTIISNTASEEGGGIYNGGSLSLIGVTLNANTAQTGGGISNHNNASTIENSTISGNRSDENGGGIYDHSILSIYNSTITANTASADPMNPGGRGGGVYSEVAAATLLKNTILYDNHHRQLFDLIDDDCYGSLHSGDYNLLGTLTNCTLLNPPGHDLTGVDPLLGELVDNGGPTQTHALLGHSPAIDGGNPAGCQGKEDILLTADQRGVYRPRDGDHDGYARCDIGAYEYPGDIFLYLPVTVR